MIKTRRTLRLLVFPLGTALLISSVLACGGDDETPEATDRASPTVDEATSSASPPTVGEALSPGTYRTQSFGIPVTFAVGEGWKKPVDNPDFFVLEHPPSADGPFGFIGFHLPRETYNPTQSNLELGPPPSDFVEWITNHRLLQIVESQPVTLGGAEGTQFEITTDTVSDFPLFKLSDDDLELRFRGHIRMVVLDVAGSQLLVTYGSDLPTNFDNFEPMAETVLATVEFGE